MTDAASFDLLGADPPESPVVLSVPHAGREYPLPLRAALRVPLAALQPLEDRHIDTVALAAQGRETIIVQRRARAWIDLNRAEAERDPRVEHGLAMTGMAAASAKLRSGLGLIPRRALTMSDIWQRKFDAEEVMERIVEDHRPYHAALATALAAARARFGVAILLDIHSMPTLGDATAMPRIVLGDRFSRAAGGRFVHRLEAVSAAAGIGTAVNTPYAGGHILDLHGHPRRGIHAVQVEFDRTLYLDPALDLPGSGLDSTAALLRRMIDAVADEALAPGCAPAAE